MSRLTDKLVAAAAVAPRQAAKIEARADRIIAAETKIEAQADESFGPHEALLAEAERGLGDVLHALAGVTNGAPLEPSTPSPAAPGPELAPAAQSFTVGSGGSGAGSLHTFRSEAEQQIAAGHGS